MKTTNCVFSVLAFVLGAVITVSGGDAFADRWVADKSINTNVVAPTKTRSTGSAVPAKRTSATQPSASLGSGLSTTNSRCNSPSSCAEGYEWSYISCQCLKPIISQCAPEACIAPSVWNQERCDCIIPSNQEESQPTEAAGSCVSRYQAELDACKSESASANQNCDSDRDSGLSQARSGLSNAAAGMGQQMGAQAACSDFGKALGAANGAVAAFTQVCSSAKNSCLSKCNSLKQALDRELSSPTAECIGTNSHVAVELSHIMESAISEVDTCRGLDAKVQQGVAAVNNLKGTVEGAMNCAAQLDTTLLYCKQNPNAIGCSAMATDCSNPTIASTSPVCICAKNPNDPSCSVSMKASSGRGGATDLASNAGLTGGSAGGGLDTGLDNVDWQGRDWKKSNDTAEDPGGSKGGRPIQDGSAGSGGSDGGSGSGADPSSVSVNSGFRGGGGGSGGGFYGGAGGSGSAAAKAAGSADSKNPDLRNFLPGGKFDPRARGIAGISGPDGITGPHSNIWQKIQNRYQAEKPKLIP
ncbi:MAG: hypothetical protein IPM97_14220 [Bdellovibrionaceae bacterium]|nr:hypothetical protein [Pseudobdellovibrionaceae bacterium]